MRFRPPASYIINFYKRCVRESNPRTFYRRRFSRPLPRPTGHATYNKADNLNRTGNIHVTNPWLHLTELYRLNTDDETWTRKTHLLRLVCIPFHHIRITRLSGLEPKPRQSKCRVLPLHHSPILFFKTPSGNTARTAMPPLGISKKRRKIWKRKYWRHGRKLKYQS